MVNEPFDPSGHKRFAVYSISRGNMRLPPVLLSILLSISLSSASSLGEEQIIMTESSPEYTPQTTVKPTLADLLTIEPSASIFYSYARELELSSILSDTSSKLTIFVPTNKAVMGLSRKP